MSPRMRERWTPDAVRKLAEREVWTTVAIAGAIFGMCPSSANNAVNRGLFPVEVIKLSGRRWLVPTAEIVRVLKLDDDAEAEAS